MVSSSVILLDDDGEAEDLFEKISLGGHGETLDSRIKARQTNAELVRGASDLNFGNALGVSSLKRIRNAQNGGELADADSIFGGECCVSGMIQLRARVAVVAGDQSDDGDIEAIQSENF